MSGLEYASTELSILCCRLVSFCFCFSVRIHFSGVQWGSSVHWNNKMKWNAFSKKWKAFEFVDCWSVWIAQMLWRLKWKRSHKSTLFHLILFWADRFSMNANNSIAVHPTGELEHTSESTNGQQIFSGNLSFSAPNFLSFNSTKFAYWCGWNEINWIRVHAQRLSALVTQQKRNFRKGNSDKKHLIKQ